MPKGTLSYIKYVDPVLFTIQDRGTQSRVRLIVLEYVHLPRTIFLYWTKGPYVSQVYDMPTHKEVL